MAVLAVEGQGPLGEIPGERREPGRDRGDGPWPAACARGAGSESREIAVSSARTSEGRSSCSATKTNTSRGATSPGCSTRPGNRRAQSWMAKPRRLCGRAPRDDGEVGRAECARPDQGGLGRRRSEQCFKLGLGDGATTRNGGSVPIGVMSAQSSGEPSRSAGFRALMPECFNWDRRLRSTAECPRPISPASARSAICAPSPSVPATRRWAYSRKPDRVRNSIGSSGER